MKGHVRKRGKASWAVIMDLGRDSTGKRRQKWHSVKGTKKDAERELARIVNEINAGSYIEPSKQTVAEFLEYWLSAYAEPNTARSTFERYRDLVQHCLVPAIGGIPIAALRPLHIQECYANALKSGRRDGRGGLSEQSVLHIHRLLRQALQHAVKWGEIARNPTDAVDPPRPERKEMTALDERQTAVLLTRCEGLAIHVPVVLAVTTGLRRGEVLGLRWDDVDLEGGFLTVKRTLEATGNGISFKTPKTDRSRRRVHLPRIALALLRAHKLEQTKRRLALGPAYVDQGLVCAKEDGGPMNPRGVSKDFRRLVQALDLPPTRFHDLRHTHATHLLRQGVHPKIVSERLGHSTIAITLDTYSHVLPGMQVDAVALVDAALGKAIAAHKMNKS
ncbi:MAG: site-specific integrase [Hyphomicrobiales bacterium]|nr:site-specific integrase [Hyphomicrobiales bacterium]